MFFIYQHRAKKETIVIVSSFLFFSDMGTTAQKLIELSPKRMVSIYQHTGTHQEKKQTNKQTNIVIVSLSLVFLKVKTTQNLMEQTKGSMF